MRTIQLDIDLISEELYLLLLEEFKKQHPNVGDLDNWVIKADTEMETKVYGVNLDLILDGLEHQRLIDFEVSDDEFMEIAEEHGLIWTLKGFEHGYNSADINDQTLIRII